MTTQYAIVKTDEITAADLTAMGELRGVEDKADAQSLLRLKINYDMESTVCKTGEWIIGQKKTKDGAAIEIQGDKVLAFIPIVSMHQYRYFNQKDASLNCQSPIFENYREEVKGSRLKVVCGKTCAIKSRDGNDRCKATKVIYGVAITASGTATDCVGYFAGTGYMPASDYVDSAKTVISGGKIYEVPICSHVAALSSEKKKNGSITYFTPIFTKAGMLGVPDIKALKEKVPAIMAMIAADNAAQTTFVFEKKVSVDSLATSLDPETLDAEIVAATPPTPPAVKPALTSDDPDIAAVIAAALNNI